VSDAAAGKLALELLGRLLDEASPVVTALQGRVRWLDVERLNELATVLKTLAGDSGACELRDAAERLETVSGYEETATSSELKAEMRAVTQALEHVRITWRSWEERANRDRSAFA
jgi:hypothetical protein